MHPERLQLACRRGDFELLVEPPRPDLPPVEACCEVQLTIPEKGRYRAVLFLLPDKNSTDPFAVMPVDEWTVPARWDDNTMLFVPSFDANHIRAAFAYILENRLEDDAFEHEANL